MADGVPITAGSGTTISTDDCGAAGHAQVFKIAISTDGSATLIPADAANGLDVDVTRLPALVAGSAEIGRVGVVDAAGDRLAVNADGSINVVGGTGGSTNAIRTAVTPTVSTTPAYTAKDAVGGLMTFSAVVATSGGTVHVVRCQVDDKAQQMKDYDLILFDRSITAPTDNAVFDPTDTEIGYRVGIIPVGGWADFNDNSGFDAGCDIIAKLNGTALYGVLVSRSPTGPTFVATTDIVVTLTTVDLSG